MNVGANRMFESPVKPMISLGVPRLGSSSSGTKNPRLAAMRNRLKMNSGQDSIFSSNSDAGGQDDRMKKIHL